MVNVSRDEAQKYCQWIAEGDDFRPKPNGSALPEVVETMMYIPLNLKKAGISANFQGTGGIDRFYDPSPS